MKKTITVSHSKTSTGKPGYKATAEAAPGEEWTAETIPNAVGKLIRVAYDDLGITEDELQAGVALGSHWDDMEDHELFYLIVRDKGLLSVEGP